MAMETMILLVVGCLLVLPALSQSPTPRLITRMDDYCPENCFCPRLEEVWCKSVPMIGISDRMWPTLENLTIINGELNRLTPRMFAQYPYLKRIQLESSRIRTIEPNAFAGLPNLRYLRLLGNDIDRLDTHSLANLNRVKDVLLTDNRIRSIARDTFVGSSHLDTLDLRHNPIERMESGAFNGLSHVKRLLLPSDIVMIEAGSFENLSDVHYLEIRSWNARESSVGGVAPGTFRGLRRVKTIQIEKSDLGVLHPRAFDDLENVEYLYIRNSMIGRIRKRSFAARGSRGSPKKLGLTKNYIDRIDYMALFVDDGKHMDQGGSTASGHKRRHHHRHQLDMNKNRLNCTCPKNSWILYEDSIQRNYSAILRNNTCSWPPSLESLDLYSVSLRLKDQLVPCEYVDDSEENGTIGRHRSASIALISLFTVAILRKLLLVS